MAKEKKMTVDTLARMTQDEFTRLGESIDTRFDAVDKRFDVVDASIQELKVGQQRILDIVLDIPSKKAFKRLEDKVYTLDARLTSVERKVK